MTGSTDQGFEYSDVIANEKLPLRVEFKYRDGICGYVYTKLYKDIDIPDDGKRVLDDKSTLNGGDKPSICRLTVDTLGSGQASGELEDHNIAIGYMDKFLTKHEELDCIENESSILRYNLPILKVVDFPALEDELENHSITFVRNLVANQTCVSPLLFDKDIYVTKYDIAYSNSLPIYTSLRTGENSCYIKVAELYHSNEILNEVHDVIPNGDFNRRRHLITAAIGIGSTHIDGKLNSQGNYHGLAGERVEDFFAEQNIIVTGVDSINFRAFGLPSYKDYYQSEQTGNIDEYAKRKNISRPQFIGNLAYPYDCPKQYLADAQYSLDSIVFHENLPLGISVRTSDGRCFRNEMKTYYVKNYPEKVMMYHNYNLHNHLEVERPVFAIMRFDHLEVSADSSNTKENNKTISNVYGEHNAVLEYLSYKEDQPNNGDIHPFYFQDATETSNINEYTHVVDYNTSFVANLMFPTACNGREALNDEDIQEYIDANTMQLSDNSNDTSIAKTSGLINAVGGAIFGMAALGISILSYKLIKSKLFKSKNSHQSKGGSNREEYKYSRLTSTTV